MKNMTYAILLVMVVLAGYSCTTVRSIDDVATCTVAVTRTDAMGVKHQDCAVYKIPKETK
jgi:hypothetical protein